MEVASKDLSRELYELAPEWRDADKFWFLDDSHHDSHPEWDEWVLVSHDMGSETIPAYSLGYLLRKLPNGTSIPKDNDIYGAVKEMPDAEDIVLVYKTPEDAACALLIELIKQGVISPNGEPTK